jgi:hypothetical protein
MLNIIDEFTHECLTIRIDRKLKSIDVIDVLSDLFVLRGVPEHIRSDNGPEFVAKARCWPRAAQARRSDTFSSALTLSCRHRPGDGRGSEVSRPPSESACPGSGPTPPAEAGVLQLQLFEPFDLIALHPATRYYSARQRKYVVSVTIVFTASAIDLPCAVRTSTCRSLTIFSGLCMDTQLV